MEFNDAENIDSQKLVKEQLTGDIKGLMDWFFNGKTPPEDGSVIDRHLRVPMSIVDHWKGRPIVASNLDIVPKGEPIINLSWSQKKEKIRDDRTISDKLGYLLGRKQHLFHIHPERRYIKIKILPDVEKNEEGKQVKWVYTLTFEGEQPPVLRAEEELFNGENVYDYKTRVNREASIEDLTAFKEILDKSKVIEGARRVVEQAEPVKV